MKTNELMRRLREGDPLSGQSLTQLMCEGADELRRYEAWVDDLLSGTFVNCVYCGHRYGPAETTPVSMADALKAHIVTCPKHPMSGLVAALTAASHALKSYQFGNGSPDLASSVAAACDKALEEARR